MRCWAKTVPANQRWSRCLFGSLKPDAGRILWNGDPVTIRTPSAARRLGIGMVFQHFSLFDSLTVAENIALSLEKGVPLATVADEARRLGEVYGLTLSPEALAGDLSVGERQRVEIIRCLLQEPQLIILDEPTSVLTPQEAERLFETLEKLKAEGKSILYISHKLEEVKRAVRSRHCAPPRQGGGPLRSAPGDGCKPRRDDGGAPKWKPCAAANPTMLRQCAREKAVLAVHALDQPPLGPFSTPLRGGAFRGACG